MTDAYKTPLRMDAAAVLTVHDMNLCGWRVVAEVSLLHPTTYHLGRYAHAE